MERRDGEGGKESGNKAEKLGGDPTAWEVKNIENRQRNGEAGQARIGIDDSVIVVIRIKTGKVWFSFCFPLLPLLYSTTLCSIYAD